MGFERQVLGTCSQAGTNTEYHSETLPDPEPTVSTTIVLAEKADFVVRSLDGGAWCVGEQGIENSVSARRAVEQ